MNERHKSGGFWRRIITYVVITAVIQSFLGIMFAATVHAGRGPISLIFLMPLVNFAYPFLYDNSNGFTSYPAAIIVGTFFMFLMVFAVGEINHQIESMPSIPPDPPEEAVKHE